MEKTVEAYLRKRVKAAGGLALTLVCPCRTGSFSCRGRGCTSRRPRTWARSPGPASGTSMTGSGRWAS